MEKERKRKRSGYAERLVLRRARFGEGPLKDRTGRALPWPRPAMEWVSPMGGVHV